MVKMSVDRQSLEGGYSSNFSIELGYVSLGSSVTVQGQTFRQGDKVVIMTEAEYEALIKKT